MGSIEMMTSALPLGNQVAHDRHVGNSQVALHVAAALRHAVHLRLLDVEVLLHGSLTYYSCNGENALTTHTT
jgi:hypothetical protein